MYLTFFFIKTVLFVQQNSKKRLTYVPAVFTIWLAIPAFLVTIAIFSTDIIKGVCVPWGAHRGYDTEKVVLAIVAFLGYILPLALMIFCYSRIIYSLRIKV